MVYWLNGLLVEWFIGLMVYWFNGLLVEWFIGLLVEMGNWLNWVKLVYSFIERLVDWGLVGLN